MAKIVAFSLLLGLTVNVQAALIEQHQIKQQSCFDFLRPLKEYFSPTYELGPRAFPPDLQQESGEVYASFQIRQRYAGEDRVVAANGASASSKAVQYLNEEERKAYRIYISEGLFVNHEGYGICPERHCRGILTMDDKSRLYFSTRPKLGEFHHSSFVAGGPVTFAGEAIFQDGHLLFVNNVSGHYFPSMRAIKSLIHELDRFDIGDYNIGVLKADAEWIGSESPQSLSGKLAYLSAQIVRNYLSKNPAHLDSEILSEKDILEGP